MPTLLRIQASPRGDHSISRALGELFTQHWCDAHPGGVVVKRDLAATPVPIMDVDWIAGVYAPPAVKRTSAMREALAASDELVAELRGADHVLVCTPMYNFTIPAALKSWIDYVVRPDLTFELAPSWRGLLGDKLTRVLIAARDVYPHGSDDDQITPVLRRAFAFMGVRDLRSLLIGGSLGVNRGEVRLDDHIARFAEPIAQMAREVGAGRD